MQRNNSRPDKSGVHRRAFEKNKRRILASQGVCAICGLPVDKTLPFPDPMSPTVDHIIPIAKGGHPSDISNLQLAHLYCNNQKRDKLIRPVSEVKEEQKDKVNNRDLPLSRNWALYGQQAKKGRPEELEESQ